MESAGLQLGVNKQWGSGCGCLGFRLSDELSFSLFVWRLADEGPVTRPYNRDDLKPITYSIVYSASLMAYSITHDLQHSPNLQSLGPRMMMATSHPYVDCRQHFSSYCPKTFHFYTGGASAGEGR